MKGATFLHGMLLGLVVCGSVQAETWEQDRWRSALLYRTTFDAQIDSDREGALDIAAVDSFEVFFNGILAGTSAAAEWQSYPVAVRPGLNHVAVRVVNHGLGGGNGLLATVAAQDSTFAATTTDRSRLTWLWSSQTPQDASWTMATGLEGDEAWRFVQAGSMTVPPAGVAGGGAEVIAGFPGDVDLGSVAGRVQLKQIRGQNLALNSVTNRFETVDGNLNTAWEPGINALGATASIDLQARHDIEMVRVLTRGLNYQDSSLRGYAIQISDDQVRWSEVASQVEVATYQKTESRFRPSWTRYVRLLITQINGVTSPRVAEIQVYGSGFATRGTYVSEPLPLAEPAAPKNVGDVSWVATVPARTSLSLQFRASDAADDSSGWDAWSAPVAVQGAGRTMVPFPSAEPRRFLQYRVNAESRDSGRSPTFDGVAFEFSTSDIPASSARGRVTPNRVPMDEESRFVYTLNLQFAAGDAGVERVQIAMPSEAELDTAQITGLDGALVAAWRATQSLLEVVFTEPLGLDGGAAELVIPFHARSYAKTHRFRAYLFAPGSERSQNVAEDPGVDPLTSEPYSWAVTATSSRRRVLSDVRANPPVLTPNGDGVNDDTVIEFILAKVDVPRAVRIEVFDLGGHLVRTLAPAGLTAGTYLRGGVASPGFWDGRDRSGRLVPPGIYLYRLELDLDEGGEVRSGVVGVVY